LEEGDELGASEDAIAGDDDLEGGREGGRERWVKMICQGRGGRRWEGREGGREGERAKMYLALCIAQAVGQGLLGKAGKNNGVDSTNARKEGREEREGGEVYQSMIWMTSRKRKGERRGENAGARKRRTARKPAWLEGARRPLAGRARLYPLSSRP